MSTKNNMQDWDLIVDLGVSGKFNYSIYAPSLNAAKAVLQSQLREKGWMLPISRIQQRQEDTQCQSA